LTKTAQIAGGEIAKNQISLTGLINIHDTHQHTARIEVLY
jgi:hypothetical protein